MIISGTILFIKSYQNKYKIVSLVAVAVAVVKRKDNDISVYYILSGFEKDR